MAKCEVVGGEACRVLYRVSDCVHAVQMKALFVEDRMGKYLDDRAAEHMMLEWLTGLRFCPTYTISSTLNRRCSDFLTYTYNDSQKIYNTLTLEDVQVSQRSGSYLYTSPSCHVCSRGHYEGVTQ